MTLNRKAAAFVATMLAAPLLFTSCTLWNMKDWQKLQDRKFYFSQFTYRLSGHDRRIAYRFMKSFPVKSMLQALSEHYGIEIDSSEFEKFLTTEDGDLLLSTSGVVFSEYFTWKSGASHKNTIEFLYSNRYEEDSTDLIRSYQLMIYTDGRLRSTVGGEIKVMGDVIPDIKSRLKQKR